MTSQQKNACRLETNRLIRSGAITRTPCEVCGEPDVDAHHENYTDPRAVHWLCKTHHTLAHQQVQIQTMRPTPSGNVGPDQRRMYSRNSGRGTYSVGVTAEETRALLAASTTLRCATPADLIRRALRTFLSVHAPELLTSNEFEERRRTSHSIWPDFDNDVRKWASGQMSLDQYVREGRSRAALYVRFRNRALELGLVENAVTTRRDEQARVVLRQWLATAAPSASNRRLATIYLKHPHWTAAAREAGVSRQRLSQVIHVARKDMFMAERVQDFPVKEIGLDISQWSDGSVWKLTEGIDFHAHVGPFLVRLRNAVAKNGWTVKTRRDLADPKVVFIRITAKTGTAS